MRMRAIIVLLIALAGCGAGVAAQMNEQWHVIKVQWEYDDVGGTSSSGEMTMTYGLEEFGIIDGESCVDDDCEEFDKGFIDNATSKISEMDCDAEEDEKERDDCNAAITVTANTVYGLDAIYGWGLFAVLSSIFAIIGISGNKFAGFFTLMLSLSLLGVAIYHIMTFPELGDYFIGQSENNFEVTEYPGQATWILGGGGILTLIGSVIGFRGGVKNDGYTEPETGGSYYHGDWGS